jgi:16S rRNA (cytosine967-C5)-methyltransferase
MTPAARLQMTIEILDGLEKTAQPADRFLKDWFRNRRFAGSKDRRDIAARVFAIQRHRASLGWRMNDESARALIIASLVEAGEDPGAVFTGGYGPAPLSDGERTAIAAARPGAPQWVRGEFPVFLEAELARAFGPGLLDEMIALQSRAPADLRVNSLKASRGDVLAALRAMDLDGQPTPYSPHGIRIAAGDGNAALSKSPLYESGAFEFQDEAAQIAALLSGAAPGERVCDLAAGAGGKTLALAAMMRNAGEILACDIRGSALFELERRAVRAGATNIKTLPLDHGAPDGLFDVVFVDAPCSGSGTWRRQPELRWRLTPARLTELMALQDSLLDRAATLLRPGGRLVYATCSILPSENQDRVAALLARNPSLVPENAAGVWQGSVPGPLPPGLAADFHATPFQTGTDGFYTALLCRA